MTVTPGAAALTITAYAPTLGPLLDFLERVVEYLLADAALAALIDDRIYPGALPQSPTLPAVVYRTRGGERVHSTDGASGLSGPTISFACHAESYNNADAVFDALRLRLDGAKTGFILGMFTDNESDAYHHRPRSYSKTADITIWSNEAN